MTPEPGPGEVRMVVKAASVNLVDFMLRQGLMSMKQPFPVTRPRSRTELAGLTGPISATRDRRLEAGAGSP